MHLIFWARRPPHLTLFEHVHYIWKEESEEKNSNLKCLIRWFAIWKFEISSQKWKFTMLESTRCGFSKWQHSNNDHSKAIDPSFPYLEICSNLVIMFGCRDLNSFWTISLSSKLGYLFWLMGGDRGSNSVFRFLFHIFESPLITISIIENLIFHVFTTHYMLMVG